MPCSCAASSASAICLAIGKRLVDRHRPAGEPIGERRSLNELHDERLTPLDVLKTIDCRDIGVIQRCEDFRFTLKAREPIGICGEAMRAAP